MLKIVFSYNEYSGFPGGSAVKNLPVNARHAGGVGLIPGSGRSPGEGPDRPLQDSCLENLVDEEPGGLESKGPQKSQTGLSD